MFVNAFGSNTDAILIAGLKYLLSVPLISWFLPAMVAESINVPLIQINSTFHSPTTRKGRGKIGSRHRSH